MTLVLVQAGTWHGAEANVYLDSRAAAAFLTAAHAYMAETGRPMPEIVEPLGGLRTVEQTTEMRWAFDHKGTAASDAIYAKYNMSRVSTARPAITGTHTTGLYFDVATAAFMAWILAGNGRRYGITRPLPNDPNHCKVSPGTETAALSLSGLTQEDDMIIDAIFSTVNKTPSWLVMNQATGKFKVYYTQADANVVANDLGHPFRQVDEQSYQNIFALFQQLSPTTAQVVIDEGKLVTDLAAALKTDPKDLATAVAVALKPQLDALPGAVVKAEGAALSGR